MFTVDVGIGEQGQSVYLSNYSVNCMRGLCEVLKENRDTLSRVAKTATKGPVHLLVTRQFSPRHLKQGGFLWGFLSIARLSDERERG